MFESGQTRILRPTTTSMSQITRCGEMAKGAVPTAKSVPGTHGYPNTLLAALMHHAGPEWSASRWLEWIPRQLRLLAVVKFASCVPAGRSSI